jgi:hypothetical protein
MNFQDDTDPGEELDSPHEEAFRSEAACNGKPFEAPIPASRYRDEKDPADTERDADVMQSLVLVVYRLGQWAGKDLVKDFAAQVVMRQAVQTPAAFALENKVSESFVFRRIREAKAVIGSPAKADK